MLSAPRRIPRLVAPFRRAALALLLASTVAALPACDDARGPRHKYNVIFIVVDTLRADYVGSENGKASTPHLDALARDGLSFPFAYSHAPMTLPAHAALFSARPPIETGVTNNGQSVPPELPLFAAVLKERGYTTQASVSLATLWPQARGKGLDRGFDRFERGATPILRGDEITARGGAMLDELAKKQPFLLFLHYCDPHEPYDAHGTALRSVELWIDGEFRETIDTSDGAYGERELILEPGQHTIEVRGEELFKLRTLALHAEDGDVPLELVEGALLRPTHAVRALACPTQPGSVAYKLRLWAHDVPRTRDVAERYRLEAEYVDDTVGALIDELKRRNLYDTSLILFTADHGESLGEHGVIGHVVNLYDEMLHVPLIIKLPAKHGARPWLARERLTLVRHMDVAPTLLDVLQLPSIPGQRGTSLLESADRLLLSETHKPEAPRTLFALRDLRTKLVYDPALGHFEMYDLVADPGELNDLFPAAGAQRMDWQRILRDFGSRPPAIPETRRELDAQTHNRLQSLGY